MKMKPAWVQKYWCSIVEYPRCSWWEGLSLLSVTLDEATVPRLRPTLANSLRAQELVVRLTISTSFQAEFFLWLRLHAALGYDKCNTGDIGRSFESVPWVPWFCRDFPAHPRLRTTERGKHVSPSLYKPKKSCEPNRIPDLMLSRSSWAPTAGRSPTRSQGVNHNVGQIRERDH